MKMQPKCLKDDSSYVLHYLNVVIASKLLRGSTRMLLSFTCYKIERIKRDKVYQ